MTEEQAGESRDGTGSGDHNVEFTFGNPRTHLTHWQWAGLLLMRGKVLDYKQGKRGGPADGDLGYTLDRPSGLSVPLAEPNPFPQE